MRCLNGRIAADDNSPDSPESIYTKCFRAKQGWNGTNTFYEFSLDPYAANGTDGNVSVGRTLVDIYFSDKAVYFNGTTDFGSGIAACYNDSLANKGQSAPSCDWDKIFATEMPGYLATSSGNLLVTEYYLDSAASTGSPRRVWCDAVTILGFTSYSLDPSVVSNPQSTVLLGSFPDPGGNPPSLVLDPSWILAAWSVNPNSSVDSDRTVAAHLQRTIQSWADLDFTNFSSSDIANFEFSNAQSEFMTLQTLLLLQALSLVDYNFTDLTTSNNKVSASDAQPVFTLSISVRVWAFGIHSRTSILGAVVSILGILVVLFRLGLALVWPSNSKDDPSETELLVAALEHTYQGEFEGLRQEKDQARVRYQIVENGGGKVSFIPKKVV